VRFRYQLAGQDHDWIEAGERRTAYYSFLPPGAYTFRVVAANSDGVWNEEGASLRITVVPPFYRTWWFLALAALSLITAVWFAYCARIAQLRRRHAEQEAFARQLIASQERERKRIAAELHDSLGQNLLLIKNRALLGTFKASAEEEAKAQFTELSDSVGQAIEEVREIAYNLRPYHLDRLGLTPTIEAMIEKVAAASGVEFRTEIPPLAGLLTPEAEISLYRVLQECVNNIARHAQATTASVTIERETHHLTITVIDNGRGFTPGETRQRAPRQGGFGLIGISERVRLLNGSHTIESAPGGGTAVRIKLNLPQQRGQRDGHGNQAPHR
jgi:signal transduction histidine kinase